MPDSRYIPRRFFRNDVDFGDPEIELEWKDRADWPDGVTEDEARAAWIQHRVAQSMRRQIAARYPTLAAFAELAGMKPARLGRILHGEYVMRLDDIGLAERMLGVTLKLVEGPPRVTGQK
jgi:hypothetical protein